MKIEYEVLGLREDYCTVEYLVVKNDKGEEFALEVDRQAGVELKLPTKTTTLSPVMARLADRLTWYSRGWSIRTVDNEIALAKTYEVAEAIEKATRPGYHDGRMESLETEVRALKELLTGLIAGLTQDPDDVEALMSRKWRQNDEE